LFIKDTTFTFKISKCSFGRTKRKYLDGYSLGSLRMRKPFTR